MRGPARAVVTLQVLTLVWLAVELVCGAVAAARARSPALSAFASDTLVEIASAVLVLVHAAGRVRVNGRVVERISAGLLVALTVVIAAESAAALAGAVSPAASRLGMAITGLSLVVMPVLAWRKGQVARVSGNAALAADATQSAACAFLAAITLAGVALNAVFHVPRIDAAAALAAVPLLLREARATWRGEGCGCG